MQKSLILVAVLASCLAAPTINKDEKAAVESLQRPHPNNPVIPFDTKLAERIIMITDPQEMSKHKRDSDTASYESKTGLTPIEPQIESPLAHKDKQQNLGEETAAEQHHRVARNGKISAKNDNDAQQKPSAILFPTGKFLSSEKSNSNSAKPGINPSPAQSAAKKPTSVYATLKHRQKRDNPYSSYQPVQLINRDQHKQPSPLGTPSDNHVRPQTLPAHSPTHMDAKRDIPVPQVAKRPHPEESPKEDDSKEKQEAKQQNKAVKELADKKYEVYAPPEPHLEHHEIESLASFASTTAHPVIRPHPVPVAELFARPKTQPID